jgi:hypothetical protein
VSVDGTGVPLSTAEAVKLTATWGPGEPRPQQKAALVGVSDTVDPQPRTPETLAARLVHPAAARARRPREHVTDETPRAQPVRRGARLVRTKPAVRARIKAAAARRDPRHRQPWVIWLEGALGLGRLAPPRFKPWTRVTGVLDIRPVVSDLWAAANARCGAAVQAGQHGVQRQRTAMLRGRVGDGIGGLRPLRTKPRRRQSVRETLATVITCCHHHRRGLPYALDLAAGVPVGTGVVESACGSVVKPRLAGEGQRWSLAGAEAMLTWRSLTKSHDHDLRDDWRFRACQMRGRLYGHTPNERPAPRWRRVASLNSKRLRSCHITGTVAVRLCRYALLVFGFGASMAPSVAARVRMARGNSACCPYAHPPLASMMGVPARIALLVGGQGNAPAHRHCRGVTAIHKGGRVLRRSEGCLSRRRGEHSGSGVAATPECGMSVTVLSRVTRHA